MTEEMIFNALIRANGVIGANAVLTATNGTIIIDTAATPTTVEASSMMAQSATVITTCTGIKISDGSAVNFKAAYNWVTLSAGIPIIAPRGTKITLITIASGSLAVYS